MLLMSMSVTHSANMDEMALSLRLHLFPLIWVPTNRHYRIDSLYKDSIGKDDLPLGRRYRQYKEPHLCK